MNHQFKVMTFGCKVNTYDSGLVEKNLLKNHFELSTGQDPDSLIYVLNTCAVTAEASKQAVREIRKIKSQKPLSTVVVTGCAAQVDTNLFETLPGADLVVANSHKGLLPFILDDYFKGKIQSKVFKSNIFKKEDLEMGGGEETSHTRSFLKIQDGCNSFCTYCIIPYARGKSRSIPISEIVRRIQEISAQGTKEVVLTGVHIGDYEDVIVKSGEKQKLVLEDLIEQVLLKTNIPRIRLTSLEPVEITERLLNLFKDERMCKHFHMSIQSANTKVLKNMKRNYTQNEVIDALKRIEKQVPNAFVGMDVIAGFPTESQEDFEDTYKTLADLPWTRLHVFPYSERPGTKALLLGEVVKPHERAERAKLLRELSLHRYQAQAMQQKNLVKKVLILKKSDKGIQGLSSDYWPVHFPEGAEGFAANEEVLARVQGYSFNGGHEGALTGVVHL